MPDKNPGFLNFCKKLNETRTETKTSYTICGQNLITYNISTTNSIGK